MFAREGFCNFTKGSTIAALIIWCVAMKMAHVLSLCRSRTNCQHVTQPLDLSDKRVLRALAFMSQCPFDHTTFRFAGLGRSEPFATMATNDISPRVHSLLDATGNLFALHRISSYFPVLRNLLTLEHVRLTIQRLPSPRTAHGIPMARPAGFKPAS